MCLFIVSVHFFSSVDDKRSSLRVVHKHGPCSQLVQDKANAPTHDQILLRDQSRVKSIQSRFSKITSASASTSKTNRVRDSKADLPVQSGSTVGAGNFIVTVGLGTPKKELSLVFDTGSDLTWTQCEPCAKYCYKQKEPTFNPSLSASYTNITCSSSLCSALISATGNVFYNQMKILVIRENSTVLKVNWKRNKFVSMRQECG